jgi:hyperosmotically inducible periplasmic protein
MKTKVSSFCLALSLSLPVSVLTSCSRNTSYERNSSSYERTAGEHVDDTAVTSRVKGALADDQEYKFGDVKVAVFKGTVQLSGFVDTAKQKRKAEEIAEKVQGVKKVENKIALKG